MAWTKFVVQTAVAGSGTGLKVALRKATGKPTTLGITILDAVGKEVGWANGDKLEVMIGEGRQHHGLVRLRKNNSVGTAVVVGKKAIHDSYYLKIALGHVPGFVDRSEPARWAKFTTEDEGWVEITLPSWAAETMPPSTEARAAAPTATIAQAASFQRPKRDAAPSIMGDPPRERSALAAR